MSNFTPVVLAAVAAIVVLAVIAAISRKGGSGQASATPAPEPAAEAASTPAPAADRMIDTCFFGIHGDQVEQTRGIVTHLWLAFFGLEDNTAEVFRRALLALRATDLTATLDLAPWMYPVGNYAKPLLPDAEQKVRDMLNLLQASGELGRITRLVMIDEPNVNERNVMGSFPEAVALIRRVAAGFPELAAVRVGAIFSGDPPDVAYQLLDDIGGDDYPSADNAVAQGGLNDRISQRLKPGQGLLMVPGGSNRLYRKPTLALWMDYARKLAEQGRKVLLCGFLWNSPPYEETLVGIANQPDLKADYEAAFRSVAAGSSAASQAV